MFNDCLSHTPQNYFLWKTCIKLVQTLKNRVENSTEENTTFYSIQEVKALEEKLIKCLNKLNFHRAAPMKVPVQTVSAFKVFEHAQFVLNHLPRPSSILSNQGSFVTAHLLLADRIEHALSLHYKEEEQLLYKPASYEAVKVSGSTVASEQGHFSRLYCPTHTQHPQNMRQQEDQGLSKGHPSAPLPPPSSRSPLKSRMEVSASSAQRLCSCPSSG